MTDDFRATDRAEIADLTVAYAYAVDERDWSAFEDLFTSDAAIDYTSSGGIAGAPAAVVAWMPEALSLFTWTMHSVSTHRIVFDGPDLAHGSLHCCARAPRGRCDLRGRLRPHRSGLAIRGAFGAHPRRQRRRVRGGPAGVAARRLNRGIPRGVSAFHRSP
jgi:hypothetical protein